MTVSRESHHFLPLRSPLVAPEDDGFWEAVQDLDLPVHIHTRLTSSGKHAAAAAATARASLGKVPLSRSVAP